MPTPNDQMEVPTSAYRQCDSSIAGLRIWYLLMSSADPEEMFGLVWLSYNAGKGQWTLSIRNGDRSLRIRMLLSAMSHGNSIKLDVEEA